VFVEMKRNWNGEERWIEFEYNTQFEGNIVSILYVIFCQRLDILYIEWISDRRIAKWAEY